VVLPPHAVHFRGRREDNALIVFHAVTDDLQVLFEIQFEQVVGPINKQRWIYSVSKQLLDRVIWAYGDKNGLK
jgi:hypothetical protein